VVVRGPQRMSEESRVEVAARPPEFYAVGLRKFAIMHAVTFGLYELQWFYENWWLIKTRRGARFNPGTRTFMAPVFAYPLFRAIRTAADEERIPTAFSPSGATIMYLLGGLCGAVLIDAVWPIALLMMYVPLHAAQALAIRVNAIRSPDAGRNESLSWANKAVLVVGGLLFVMALLGPRLE
jgi:hypothetical protein